MMQSDVYLKDKSVFKKISTLIRKGLSVTSIDENINAKQEEKEKISKDIDFILKERMQAVAISKKSLIASTQN